jgi:hypothetical protein
MLREKRDVPERTTEQLRVKGVTWSEYLRTPILLGALWLGGTAVYWGLYITNY